MHRVVFLATALSGLTYDDRIHGAYVTNVDGLADISGLCIWRYLQRIMYAYMDNVDITSKRGVD